MIIDLRSDTVTKPTKEMLEAMFGAEVGDDIFDEDPTVIKLQQKVAKILNKEAAIYTPSGTMANQMAIKLHTQPGDEVICDITSHIYNFEGGGISFNSGASVKLIYGDNGRVKANQVLESINPHNIHAANSSLVSLENTSNKGGGSCYDIADIKEIAAVCKNNNLKFHLDGARLFNAVVKKGYSASEIGNLFDSVSICLSKGLGAPIGSVLAGTSEFITRAKRYRKLFGGAMRQAGYLAAAGIYALDNHIPRLKEDHENAQALVNMLQKQSYVEEILPTETNIVIFRLSKSIKDEDFMNQLNQMNVKVIGFGPQVIRMVTHLDFKTEMLEEVEKALAKIN
ncbi:MAG: GntG family PLP-dependent aldolase [Bacteroidales bacterium]|nr:GntG family PLP-dependent aldolase [Bacteroidales bacterium]